MTTAHTHPDIRRVRKARQAERWRQDQLGPNPEIPTSLEPLAQPGELERLAPEAPPAPTGRGSLLDAIREGPAEEGRGKSLLGAMREPAAGPSLLDAMRQGPPPQRRGQPAKRYDDEWRFPRSPDKLLGILGEQRKKWLHPELVKEVAKLPGPVRAAFYERAERLIFGFKPGEEVGLAGGLPGGESTSIMPPEKYAKLKASWTRNTDALADEALHLGQLGAYEEPLRPLLRALASYKGAILLAEQEAEYRTATIKDRARRQRARVAMAARGRAAAVAELRKEMKPFLKPMALAGGAVDVLRAGLVGLGAEGLRDTGPRDEREAIMRAALEPETGARAVGGLMGVAGMLTVAPGPAARVLAGAALGRGEAIEAGADPELGALVGGTTFAAFQLVGKGVGRFKNIRALGKRFKIPYRDAKAVYAAGKAGDSAKAGQALHDAYMSQMVPEVDQKAARTIQRLLREGDRLAREGAKAGVRQVGKEAQLDRRAAQLYRRWRAKAEAKGLYAQLGLRPDASPDEINLALEQVLKLGVRPAGPPSPAQAAQHQAEKDLLKTGTEAQKATVRAAMVARAKALTPSEAMKARSAYEVLRNPDLRAKYDAGRLTRSDWRLRVSAPAARPAALPRPQLAAQGRPLLTEAAEPLAVGQLEAAYQANLKAAAAGSMEFRSPRVAWTYMVHPSARQPGQWQVTTMGEGEPSGHYEFSTKEAAIASISGKAVEGPAIGDGTWAAVPVAPKPAAAVAEAKIARAATQRQGRERKALERELVTYYENLTGEDVALARERVEAGTPDAEQYGFDSFKTAFAGKVPTELTEALQGRRRLRMMVKGNVPGALGEDFLKAIGTDRYVEGLETISAGAKGDVERAVAWLEGTVKGDVPHADMALKIKRYRALQAGGPQAVEVMTPEDLRPGDAFTSEGDRYQVIAKSGGGITIKNDVKGEVAPGAKLLIDKGSLTRALVQVPTRPTADEAPTDVGPFTDAVGKELGATPPGIEAPPAKAKQAWEMTQAEYARESWQAVLRRFRERPDILDAKNRDEEIAHFRTLHAGAVAAAVQEGRSVPRAVLEEYKGKDWAKQALAVLAEKPAPAPTQPEVDLTPPARPPKTDLLGETYVEPIRGKQKELMAGTEASPERILGPAHEPRPYTPPPTEVKPDELGAKLPGMEPEPTPAPPARAPEHAELMKQTKTALLALARGEGVTIPYTWPKPQIVDMILSERAHRAAEAAPAKVKMMITGADRADLKAMGYTGKQIAKLTPAGAQKILDAGRRGAPSGVEASLIDAELPAGAAPGAPEPPGRLARLWARAKKAMGRPTDVTPRAIILRMAKTYGQALRTGRLRARTAAGTYAVREELVRLRNATSIPTACHELGHHLQKTLWPKARTPARKDLSSRAFMGGPRGMWKEISKLAYPGAKKKMTEGFAEFIRLYLTEPGKAASKAPILHAWFENQLKLRNPEIADALLQTRAEIQAYLAQDSKAKVLAQLSLGQRGPRKMSLESLVTRTLDQYEPLRRAAKEALGTDAPIIDDFYKLARLYEGAAPGRALAALFDGIRDYNDPTQVLSEPLVKILKPVGDRLDDLRAYLAARRSLELNKRHITTGIHPRDAQATVRGFKDDAEITTAAKGIYEFQDAFVDYLVDAGLLAEDHAAAMRNASRAYVPFYRVFEEIERSASAGGKKFVNLPQAIKKIKGSGRPIIDPLESIVRNVFYFTGLVEKNRVAVAIVRASESQEGLGWLAIKAKKKTYPTRITIDEMFEMMKKFGIVPEEGKPGEAGPEVTAYVNIFRASMYPSAKENIAVVFRKGEAELWQFDPDVHATLTGMGQEATSMFVRLLAKPASWLRTGATMTPDFISRNVLRDGWTAAVYSNYGFIPGVDVVRGLFHVVKQDKLYWDWQAAGGAHGQLVSVDRKVLQDALGRISENPDWMDAAWGAITHPWRWMNVLRRGSEYAEEATRVGEYARAPKGSVRETLDAAYSARELTVDFRRVGTGLKNYNKVTAFFNAQVQGPARTIRAFRQNPGRSTAKALLHITVPSIILYAINRDREDYWELPAWRRMLCWNIPLGGGRFLLIPKPFELGMLFGTLPETILAWIDKKNPGALNEWAKEIKRQLVPSFIPTALLPYVEWTGNYSFFRERALVPESEKRKPPEEQYGPWTSETAKQLGKWLKVSPRKLDNSVSSWFGGMGRYATDLSDVAIRVIARKGSVPKPLRWWERVPGVKTFFTQAYRSNSDSIDDFYVKLAEAEIAAQRAAKKVLPGLAERIRARTDLGKKEKQRHLKDVAEGRVPSEYLPEAVVIERDRLRFAALRLRYLRKRTKEILADPLMPAGMKAEQMQKFAFEMIQAARAGIGRPKLKNMAEALALPEGEAALKKINKATMSKAHALTGADVSAVRGKALVRSLQDAGIGLAQAKELIREYYRLRPLKEPTKRRDRAKRDKTIGDRLRRLARRWDAAGGTEK